MVLLSLPFISDTVFQSNGFTFESVDPGSPDANISLPPNTVFTQVNGNYISSQKNLTYSLKDLQPGSTVILANEHETYTLIAAQNPSNSSKGYIGIRDIRTHFEPKFNVLPQFSVAVFSWLVEFFAVLYFLNLAIGMVNLLPLGPIDGGRMFLLASTSIFGKEKGTKIWGWLSVALLAIVLILLIPIIKAIFFSFFKA